jgi:hypothetical protein
MRTHTGPRFIISFEGCESHQPQVIWASHTNLKILGPDGAWTLNLSHWRRTRYHWATGSLFWSNFFPGLATQQDWCLLRFIQDSCFTPFIWFIKDVHKWKLVSWYTQEKCSNKYNKDIGQKWLITPLFQVIYYVLVITCDLVQVKYISQPWLQGLEWSIQLNAAF